MNPNDRLSLRNVGITFILIALGILLVAGTVSLLYNFIGPVAGFVGIFLGIGIIGVIMLAVARWWP